MNTDLYRPVGVTCVTAGAAVLIDQASKTIAVDNLTEGERVPIIDGVFGLQLVYNPGAAFSLGAGSTWILTVLAATASVFLLIVAFRPRSDLWAVTIGLLLGGALGNLIDRLFSPPGFGIGHVTDFLAYGDLFIGNIADIVLLAGVTLLIVLFLRGRRRLPNHRDTTTAPPTTSTAPPAEAPST